MKQVFLYFVLILIVSTSSGCWQKNASPSDESNAAVVAAEDQFANITDANEALAEGDRLMDENQTEMAIAAYRQAVKLNPDFAEAYFKLGVAYSLLERQIEQSGEIT